MADLTITAANVIKGTGARVQNQTCGEVVNIGDLVCLNPSNQNKVYQAGANESVDTFRTSLSGISLSNTAAGGQPISYAFSTGDVIGLGAILEQGMFYVLSANRAKICPVTDFAIFSVINKALTSNVATLTTAIPYAFVAGQTVTIAGVDTNLNGSFVIASTPTTTTFTYAKTTTNISSTSCTGTAQLKGAVMNLLGIAQTNSNLEILVSATGIAR